MDDILPTSFSEDPTAPCDLDCRNVVADVSVDTRTPYEAWSDSMVSDPAWYSADIIAHESSVLEAELETLLAEQAATPHEPVGLLPGFETLTWADLDRAARSDCAVGWCMHQGQPVHSDGFDPDPDQAPHRSVEHTIRAIHGGESIDRAGRAEVTIQLEQDHDQQSDPTVNLSVVVRGIEQYAWLTLPEVRALRSSLDHLLSEANTRADIG